MAQVESGRFAPPQPEVAQRTVLNAVLAAFFLYVFLVGVECLASGIGGIGQRVDMASYLGTAEAPLNPMLAILAGILATTLVQSSSVSTALIVATVGSGQLPIASAVPMIMGANIGTTVTNTIASLAHATRSGEFRRAFAAATCHDFFNFLAVAVLLPIELLVRAIFGEGLIEMASAPLAELTSSGRGVEYQSPIKAAFKAGQSVVQTPLEWVFSGEAAVHIALAVAGVAIIFLALWGIVRSMRVLVLSRLESYVNRFLGSGGPVGILVGIVLTVLVQSSSITTSVLVPLVGAGLMTTRQIYPITLGANLGTTITALLASMAVSGEFAEAARQIAIVHLLFNSLGMLIWYAPAPLRWVPVRLAERLASTAARSRRWALAYVIGAFYALPAAIFFISRLFG